MDTDTLERLMLDRGVGALSPDCAALLDDYLGSDSGAMEKGREIYETIELARGALGNSGAVKVPAFPAERLARSQRRIRSWRIIRNISGLAAAILVGFAIRGFVMPAQPRTDAPGVQFVEMHASSSPRDTHETNNGFWSTRRLYERAAAVREQPKPRVIWRSPVLLPLRGDAT